MRQKLTQRKGVARRWRTNAPTSGAPGFHLYFVWSWWPLARRVARTGPRLTYASDERHLLAPHVERAAREREEERIFREQFRARLRPVSVDKPPTPPQATQLPIIRSSSAISAPTAQRTTSASGASGASGASDQGASTSAPSAFTAAVMARISTPATGAPDAATADAPPQAPPAMSFAFGATPGGRGISYTLVAQYIRALFGVYGVAALIVLLSGALFSFFAPTLVFTGLSMLVSTLIVAITEAGKVWRMLDGMVGGLGVLYLALTLLVAPFLLLAFQARAGSDYSKA